MKKFRRNKILPIVAAWAMLLHAVLPFVAVYPAEAAIAPTETSQLSSLFGDKILICTSSGFRWVRWDDLRSGKEQMPQPHEQYKCPLCYVSSHGGKHVVLSKALELSYVPVADAWMQSFVETPDFSALQLTYFYQSRAPPFSIIG